VHLFGFIITIRGTSLFPNVRRLLSHILLLRAIEFVTQLNPRSKVVSKQLLESQLVDESLAITGCLYCMLLRFWLVEDLGELSGGPAGCSEVTRGGCSYAWNFSVTRSTVLGRQTEGLDQAWRAFLRARAQIVSKFRGNSFACPWKF